MSSSEQWSAGKLRKSLLIDERTKQPMNDEPAEAKTNRQQSRWLIYAAFAAVYLIWGSTYLGIKYAIESLPPFLMAGTRFLVAGAALYAWAWVRGERSGAAEHPRRALWRTAFIVGGLLLLCGNGGVTWAERSIPSGLAALLVATEPLWIVLLNWARPGGVRPGFRVLLGLLVGFAGVWLLIGKGISGGEVDLFGAALVIGAAFAWAAGSIYSLRAPVHSSPLLASGMQMLAGGALLMFTSLLAGEWTSFDLSKVSAVSAGALLYLIVFGSIIAFTAYSWLLRVTTPARAATYAYVNPVVAVLLGWAMASEALSWRMLTGAGVIVAAVALITSYGKHHEPEAKATRAIQDCIYGEALLLITAEDAAGWFTSCGHPVR